MTVTTVMVAQVVFTGCTVSDDRPDSDIRLVKRDVEFNENESDSNEGFFYSLVHFFGSSKHDQDGDKPDFITTFDLIRLLDEKYAMKQFYCVINEGQCDSVGLRLKGMR